MKREQRRLVKMRLSSFSQKEEASASIWQRIRTNEHYRTAQKVAVFLSTDEEPDTAPLIADALRQGKRVFAPKIDSDTMYFVEITEKTTFSVGKYDIREPLGEVYDGSFDVMFLPLVAFDRYKNRLGHGKGYYDKFLANRTVYKIGLAFSCQELDHVETDAFDIRLDEILQA